VTHIGKEIALMVSGKLFLQLVEESSSKWHSGLLKIDHSILSEDTLSQMTCGFGFNFQNRI
jgi:hypothetical protein